MAVDHRAFGGMRSFARLDADAPRLLWMETIMQQARTRGNRGRVSVFSLRGTYATWSAQTVLSHPICNNLFAAEMPIIATTSSRERWNSKRPWSCSQLIATRTSNASQYTNVNRNPPKPAAPCAIVSALCQTPPDYILLSSF